MKRYIIRFIDGLLAWLPAVTSKWFTVELAYFLQRNGALKRAEIAYINDKEKGQYKFVYHRWPKSKSLVSSFVFSETYEGFDFWNDLSIKWDRI